MARHKPDWSDLYPEILTTIAHKLPTRFDVTNFQSVCKNWRSSIPQIPNHLPFFSPDFPYRLSRTFPNFSDSRIKLCVNSTFLVCPLQNPSPNVPSKPWLVTLEELSPGKLFIRRPLTRLSLAMPEKLISLDLSGFSIREIRRGYTPRGDRISPNSKVVLFYNPANVLDSVDDCYALMLDSSGCLGFVRLENENACGWLTHSRVSCFDDIVNYKGDIWAIDRKGRVYFIPYVNNRKSLKLNLYANDVANLGHVEYSKKQLMESSEGLYLIVMHPQYQKIKFSIYKLDEVERKWSEVNSLDGRILFVTSDCCFFGLVEDFPGLRGDCVVFPKGHFPTYNSYRYPDEDFFEGADEMLEVGVFRLDDGESGLLSNDRGLGLISNYRDFSELFLPSWLFPDMYPCGREDDEEDYPEVCSIEEMCYVASAIETTEDPTINGQEKCDDGVDVPWSDIPSKILTEIAKHLKTPISLCRCRAVCKKWRTSLPPPRNSNLLCFLLPHKFSSILTPLADAIPSLESFRSPALVASTIYLVQPSSKSVGPLKSWMVTVEEVNPGKLFLRMPLRRFAIEELPDNFPKVWDLSNFHVSEIGREYNFRDASYLRDMFYQYYAFSFSNSHMVVLYHSSVGTCCTMDDTTVLVWYDGKLVSFRLRDNSWFAVRHGSVSKFDDVVNYKGKIYAIDRRGRAYVIDCDSSKVSRVVSEAIVCGTSPEKQKRLVGSDRELYLLVRNSPNEKIFFNVYRMNKEQNKWEEINSLDGKILFVTTTCCFLASARDFPGWKGDCVVFPEDSQPTQNGGTHPDMSFFSRVDKELRIGVFYLGDNDGAKLIRSYRGYSDLFWPPQPWLQLAECKSRNELDCVDVPCVDSQQEQASSTTAEEGSAESETKSEAAEFETKSLVVLRVQDSEAAGASKTIEVSVRPELGVILQKIWEKHGNITEQSAVSSNPEAVSQALESLAEAVLILKTTSWRCLSESQADILRATMAGLKQKQFRVEWLSLLVEKALLCQTGLPLLELLRDERSKIQKIKRQLPETKGLTDAELESLKKGMGDNFLELVSQTLGLEIKNDARMKTVEGLVRVLGPIDVESCIGEGLFLPPMEYAAF